VGLLRIDREGAAVPPAASDILMAKDVNSTLFKVEPVVVAGLDAATVKAGKGLSAAQQNALAEAVTGLTKKGVIAVTADSGLFIHYQLEATKLTSLPVLLSPLLQAPLLTSALSQHEVVLVITADSKAFGQVDLEAALVKYRLTAGAAGAKRFILRGLEHIPGFGDPSKPIEVEAAVDWCPRKFCPGCAGSAHPPSLGS